MTTNSVTTSAEAIVRRAYHLGEGNVMDVQGFMDLFAAEGVIDAGLNSSDVHWELHRVHVMDDVIALELSIQGTFTGVFESPAGVIHGNGAKLDVPGADFWYVEDGKIKACNCHVGVSIMLAQMGIQTDFASAVKATAVTG